MILTNIHLFFHFILFSLTLCQSSIKFSSSGLNNSQSSFKNEYPGVNICQSGNIQDLNLHSPETRWKDIMNLNANNCTHLQGSLYIRGLRNNSGKNILLDSIREIDGHLIIESNDVKLISLKNLVVIRGIVSKSHTMSQKNESVSISLQVTGNMNLETLDLRSLRSIAEHDVLIDNNPLLRYIPHKINWTELFEFPKSQRLHSTVMSPESLKRDVCDADCYVWPKSGDSFCWGPSKSQCQIKTYCQKFQGLCSTCFYDNGAETACCDMQCLGGCRNVGTKSCSTCKNQLDGDSCIQSCPSGFKGGIAGSKQKTSFKYFSGLFCSTSCPDNMLPQENECVAHCSTGYYKNESNHCVKCYEDKCKKENIPCDLMKIIGNDERNMILSAKILVQLTNCTKILGYIVITESSFKKYNVTEKMLYDHLGNLENLDGGFNYFFDNNLRNLSFLSKLRTFRATNLHAYLQGSAAYNKFTISRTKLKFLGLKSLRNISGTVIIRENTDLCYLKLPWKEIAHPSPFIQAKNCSDICDTECSNKGCWMSGNKWCYECQKFNANDQCVSECSSVKGYFLANKSIEIAKHKNVSCDKCNEECAVTCRSKAPNDCIGGCVNKEENGTCVKRCSFSTYNKKNTNKCLPCSGDCATLYGLPKCFGPSNIPGPGGCNKCHYILIQRKLESIQKDIIVNCVSQCPSRTFARATNNEGINYYFKNIGYVCEPCNRLCKSCTGRRVHKDDCQICEGYWNKDVCVKACPKDSTYNFTVVGPSRICSRCDPACLSGCTGPKNSDCKKCKDRKIYTNGTNFYCAKTCPKHKSFEEKEQESGDFVCISVWDSAAKLEEAKRTKIVIIVIVTMFIIIAIVIVLLVICLRKKAMAERMEAKLKAVYSNLTEPNSKDENAFSKPANMGRLLIISIEDLIFEDQTRPLGFGAFGYVYKGKWKIPKEDDTLIRKSAGDFYLPVAIKVIKNIEANQHEAIMQEAKIMSSVSHLHCLRFIGICLSYEMPCLVTAYVKEGSLDKYLVRNKIKITSRIMLNWAEQIADGMLYLTKRGIIHRDLAARNILVSQQDCIQITDFGLSKMLETADETGIFVKSGKVPIRWLAIETLLEGRYSYETDVWAYGVTLWEIFTFGKLPYQDQATHDISEFVLKGGRLSQPEICSLDVYIVMVNCWLESPNLRPTFESLMRTFMDYGKNPGRYLSIQGDPFEIPSPSNIEMTNLNNPYFDHNTPFPGTAETMLPLLNGRDSIDGVFRESTFNKEAMLPISDESKQLLSDDEDLPTRAENRGSTLFKRFHDKNQSVISQNGGDNGNNVTPRLVPLASVEEPSFRGSTIDEDPRYVPDPSDKSITLRQPQINQRKPFSRTPGLNSYRPEVNSSVATVNDDTDGYLEPIRSPNASHISVLSNDADGYLEPVSMKKNLTVDQDEYMVPSYNNSPRMSEVSTNNNAASSRLPSVARQSTKLPSMSEERSPSNLYFTQNLVDDQYLEPSPQSALIK